jgi:hypothetical protein
MLPFSGNIAENLSDPISAFYIAFFTLYAKTVFSHESVASGVVKRQRRRVQRPNGGQWVDFVVRLDFLAIS